MKTLEILKSVYGYFRYSRAAGHSFLAKKCAEENDAVILVPFETDKLLLGKQSLSFTDLDRQRGKPCRPTLVDNHTMLVITGYAIGEIEQLQHDIQEQNRKHALLQKQIESQNLRLWELVTEREEYKKLYLDLINDIQDWIKEVPSDIY